MENKIKQTEEKELKTYELGYLLSPMIPAEASVEIVANVIAPVLEARTGNIISQVSPKMKVLAYEVLKSVNNKNSKFKEAYFGVIKFQADPVTILDITKLLDKNADIVRFLLIAIPKGAERVVAPKRSLTRKPKADVKEEGGLLVSSEEKGEPMSSEEIDKEIEGLIADATV